MPESTDYIHPGHQVITPALTVSDTEGAIDFYKRVFGAQVGMISRAEDGTIYYAELKIGDLTFMLNYTVPDQWNLTGKPYRSPHALGGTCVRLVLYNEDTDALFERAVAAGAAADSPPRDAYWGDRYAVITDPFGHCWKLSTHKEDIAPEEHQQRLQALFAERRAQDQG